MPSPWGGRWSTLSSPRCRRTPGSSFRGTPALPSSRRSRKAVHRQGDSAMMPPSWELIMAGAKRAFDPSCGGEAGDSGYHSLRVKLDEAVHDFAERNGVPESLLALL